MAKDSPSQMMPKVQIRMDESLRQLLMKAAYKSDRSLNAEIVARLERSFGDDGLAEDVAERLAKIEADLPRLLELGAAFEKWEKSQ